MPAAPETGPSVRSFDKESGTLTLVSPGHRRDWDRDGILPFRGHFFRLDRTKNEGGSWVYSFARVDIDEENDRILRLAPPSSRSMPSSGNRWEAFLAGSFVRFIAILSHPKQEAINFFHPLQTH